MYKTGAIRKQFYPYTRYTPQFTIFHNPVINLAPSECMKHSFLFSHSFVLLFRNVPMKRHTILMLNKKVFSPSFTQTKDGNHWILAAHLDFFFVAAIVLKIIVKSKKIGLVCFPSKHVLKIFSCNCLAVIFLCAKHGSSFSPFIFRQQLVAVNRSTLSELWSETTHLFGFQTTEVHSA